MPDDNENIDQTESTPEESMERNLMDHIFLSNLDTDPKFDDMHFRSIEFEMHFGSYDATIVYSCN